MTLAIALDNRHTPPALALHGDIDLNTAPQLVEEANRLIDTGCRVLLLDLSGVEFCDSSGLSALVRLRNRLQPLGGRVSLAGPTPIVQRVLEVSGLTEIFGTYPTLDSARAAAAEGDRAAGEGDRAAAAEGDRAAGEGDRAAAGEDDRAAGG